MHEKKVGDNKTVSIFRTKQQMEEAVAKNKFIITKDVYESQDYLTAERNEILGFKLLEGSDFTVVEVKKVKNDPQAFMKYAFGEVVDDGTKH